MPVDTQQILDAADSLGKLVAQHPAVERYRQAQKSLAEDTDAGRLLNEFNRQIMTLARQEESGMPVTDAQRRQLEGLQAQLASHLKVKALNIAQMEFVDLMRKVSDGIRKQVSELPGTPGGEGAPAPGTKLTI
ncbi:MAG: YlbF family regulator [Bacillota bacterium]